MFWTGRSVSEGMTLAAAAVVAMLLVLSVLSSVYRCICVALKSLASYVQIGAIIEAKCQVGSRSILPVTSACLCVVARKVVRVVWFHKQHISSSAPGFVLLSRVGSNVPHIVVF